jgi:hypothetical protein
MFVKRFYSAKNVSDEEQILFGLSLHAPEQLTLDMVLCSKVTQFTSNMYRISEGL